MAELLPAFRRTMGVEKLYANTQGDPGGETVWGIARVFNPSWSGWPLVDRARFRPGFPNNMANDQELIEKALQFYRLVYWDRFAGDRIPSQAIANEMFDTSINISLGVHRTVTWLQMSLNKLNRGGKDYPDVTVDGWIGDETLGALRMCMRARGARAEAVIVKCLDGLQFGYYFERADEEFFMGLVDQRVFAESDGGAFGW